MPKKTHDEFEKEITQLVGNEYMFYTKYEKSDKKIKTKHIKCGYIWEVKASHLLSSVRNHKIMCPNCNGNARLTQEEFIKRVKEAVGDEYEVLSEYKNNNNKVKLKHKKCRNIYEVSPSGFLDRGNRCPCNYKVTQEMFIDEVYKLVGNEYTVVGEYIQSKTKIKIRHNVCNKINEVQPNAFLLGSRCPFCNIERQRKTQEEFEDEVFNLEGDNYKVIGKYSNYITKIKITHKKCGNIYLVTPANFIGGKRCPKCKQSKGEAKISKWLEQNSINFIPQYIIEDCKHKKPLRFDFAIFDNEDILVYLLEYDGEFHYHPARYSRDTEKMERRLKECQHRDIIKNQYCYDNEIPILRIPYWDFNNIEGILNDFSYELNK